MARRSIWKGVVSFGMVAIPIKLYTATESKDVSFVLLHKTCHTRLKQKRFCPEHETEVPYDETVRAYEYAKEQYVVMREEDFENLPVSSLHTIEIVRFVDLPSIDPINFERSYMLEPEGVGLKPFYLLKQALENTQRVAVAKVSLRQKEQICCLRPFDHGIVLQTMHWPDEIRGINELNLPEEQAAISAPEMSMATALIDQLTGVYDSTSHHDEYRLELEKVIQAKLMSQELSVARAKPVPGKVGDLMEALKASIAAAKKERAKTSRQVPEVQEAEAPKARRKPPAPAVATMRRSKGK